MFKKIFMLGIAIAISSIPVSEAADYLNIGTYQANESAFLSSSSGSSFIAAKWKEAEQQINNEAGRVEKNMAKDSDSEKQKKDKYKKLNEVIESPLIKTGTVNEEYKDANGHVFLKASGSTASGSFSEEGFATGNLSKSSKKVIMENRYGNAVSNEGTFDYIVFTKKTINEDGSWNSQSRLVVGDSNHPKFQTYYATVTARGLANGEVHEFTRGIAIDVDKNIRNVEQSIVYHIGIDQYNLATALGSIPAETQDADIELLENKYSITDTDDDIQQQCLNDGIDVSQCSIPSFLMEYSKLKANNDYEGIARLTSGIIEKDALANAGDDDANGLFAEIDGKVAAAGVVTLGAALGAYSVLRRKEDTQNGAGKNTEEGAYPEEIVIPGYDDYSPSEKETAKEIAAAVGATAVIAAGLYFGAPAAIATGIEAVASRVAVTAGTALASRFPALESRLPSFFKASETAAENKAAATSADIFLKESDPLLKGLGTATETAAKETATKAAETVAKETATKAAETATKETATKAAETAAKETATKTAETTGKETVETIVDKVNTRATDAIQKAYDKASMQEDGTFAESMTKALYTERSSLIKKMKTASDAEKTALKKDISIIEDNIMKYGSKEDKIDILQSRIKTYSKTLKNSSDVSEKVRATNDKLLAELEKARLEGKNTILVGVKSAREAAKSWKKSLYDAIFSGSK